MSRPDNNVLAEICLQKPTWARLTTATLSGYIEDPDGSSMLDDCLEIKRMLIAALKTVKAEGSR